MDIFVYITLCFTSLFTLMDPLGVMPVFLQMTDGMDTKERRCIALKACTIAFIILVLFTLSGRFLFHFFGISTNGFRIVGGIIIFKIGYDMLQAHFTHVKLNETERKEYSKDITITPLAIPMLCGPGAISSGITLMEDASEYTFQNSIAWRNRFGLHSFILYSVRVHPAFKNLGRDGKQCDDETDGTYSNGDRRGMFYQRDTSGIN